MVEARPCAAHGDGEVDARVIQHPFGVVGFHYARPRREQGRVETDGLVQTVHGDVDVHALHRTVSFVRLRAGFCGSTGRGRAQLGLAAAAVFGEVAEQVVHGLVARRVDQRAALAGDADEAGMTQTVEMKRQRVGGDADRGRHLSGRHAVRPRLHQQTVNVEPILLCQRGQGRNGIYLFHISTIIEMMYRLSSRRRRVGATRRR